MSNKLEEGKKKKKKPAAGKKEKCCREFVTDSCHSLLSGLASMDPYRSNPYGGKLAAVYVIT